MKKLLINLLLNYSTTFVSFIIILLLAQILGAENFSWVALGVAIGGFIVPLVNLGSDRTFVRDAIDWTKVRLIKDLIILNFGQRVFVLLPVAMVLIATLYFLTDTLSDAVSLLCFSLWAGLIGLYPASWFDYSGEIKTQNLILLGERLTSLAMIGIFYFYTSSTSVILIIGTCLLGIRSLSIIFQIKTWWSRHVNSPFRLILMIPQQNKNGINLDVTLATLANAVLTYGNQLLLAANRNPSELSAYGLAFQMMMIVFLFQGQVIRLTSKSIVEACRSNKDILSSLAYDVWLLFVGSAILALGAWIVLQILPYFLQDVRFEVMSKFAIPLCIWVILAGVGLAISQYNLALNQDRLYLLTAIGGAVVALLLGFLFIPHYGAFAVAVILLFVHGTIISLNALRLFYVIRAEEA